MHKSTPHSLRVLTANLLSNAPYKGIMVTVTGTIDGDDGLSDARYDYMDSPSVHGRARGGARDTPYSVGTAAAEIEAAGTTPASGLTAKSMDLITTLNWVFIVGFAAYGSFFLWNSNRCLAHSSYNESMAKYINGACSQTDPDPTANISYEDAIARWEMCCWPLDGLSNTTCFPATDVVVDVGTVTDYEKCCQPVLVDAFNDCPEAATYRLADFWMKLITTGWVFIYFLCHIVSTSCYKWSKDRYYLRNFAYMWSACLFFLVLGGVFTSGVFEGFERGEDWVISMDASWDADSPGARQQHKEFNIIGLGGVVILFGTSATWFVCLTFLRVYATSDQRKPSWCTLCCEQCRRATVLLVLCLQAFGRGCLVFGTFGLEPTNMGIVPLLGPVVSIVRQCSIEPNFLDAYVNILADAGVFDPIQNDQDCSSNITWTDVWVGLSLCVDLLVYILFGVQAMQIKHKLSQPTYLFNGRARLVRQKQVVFAMLVWSVLVTTIVSQLLSIACAYWLPNVYYWRQVLPTDGVGVSTFERLGAMGAPGVGNTGDGTAVYGLIVTCTCAIAEMFRPKVLTCCGRNIRGPIVETLPKATKIDFQWNIAAADAALRALRDQYAKLTADARTPAAKEAAKAATEAAAEACSKFHEFVALMAVASSPAQRDRRDDTDNACRVKDEATLAVAAAADNAVKAAITVAEGAVKASDEAKQCEITTSTSSELAQSTDDAVEAAAKVGAVAEGAKQVAHEATSTICTQEYALLHARKAVRVAAHAADAVDAAIHAADTDATAVDVVTISGLDGDVHMAQRAYCNKVECPACDKSPRHRIGGQRIDGVYTIEVKKEGIKVVITIDQLWKHVVVAIRGSQVAANWWTNFNCLTRDCSLKDLEDFSDNATGIPRVHYGFWKFLETPWTGDDNCDCHGRTDKRQNESITVFQRIVQVLTNAEGIGTHLLGEDPSTMVVRCVGHSLGAAVATILALRLHCQHTRRVTCTTFGSPRVGDQNFAEFYNNLGIPTHRFATELDMVTMVPPYWLLRLVHVGKLYLLTTQGGVFKNPTSVEKSFRHFLCCGIPQHKAKAYRRRFLRHLGMQGTRAFFREHVESNHSLLVWNPDGAACDHSRALDDLTAVQVTR